MSRSLRTSRKPNGCGPRYCWCCDAKRCDRYVHDRWGATDTAEQLDGEPPPSLPRGRWQRIRPTR